MIKIVLLLQLITAVIKMSITDVNTDTKTDVEGKKKLPTKRYLSLEFDLIIYFSFVKCIIWIYSIEIAFNIPTDFILERI